MFRSVVKLSFILLLLSFLGALFAFRSNALKHRRTQNSLASLGMIGPKGNGRVGRKGCPLCAGLGGINCKTCSGTGIDKKGGDFLQRFMCRKCFGFGFVGCTCTGAKGLTPEQTGER